LRFPVLLRNIRAPMTPATFKAKWAKFSGKESAAYAEHFNDLCRMLGVPTPIEADPTGNDTFCFQKRVAKDAELFDFETDGKSEPAKQERGFADVWKRECFGWEYKGPGEDLEKAYKQLLRYRESLLNPPLLIVCDFDRFIVRTNFNGAVQETHTFTNAEIDSPPQFGFCAPRSRTRQNCGRKKRRRRLPKSWRNKSPTLPALCRSAKRSSWRTPKPGRSIMSRKRRICA
jgi:hypothetical protein